MMNTTKKIMGFLTVVAMLASSATVLSGTSASAAQYVPGDVDMDGVITGHDSAMVSRYIYVDSTLLSDEQLEIADMNGDGAVDQTDADLIHVREVYTLGVTSSTVNRMNYPSAIDACYMLMLNGKQNLGTLEIDNNGSTELIVDEVNGLDMEESGTFTVSALTYNLLDMDGDGTVTALDACAALTVNAICNTYAYRDADGNFLVGTDFIYEQTNGRYDLSVDTLDMSGWVVRSELS